MAGGGSRRTTSTSGSATGRVMQAEPEQVTLTLVAGVELIPAARLLATGDRRPRRSCSTRTVLPSTAGATFTSPTPGNRPGASSVSPSGTITTVAGRGGRAIPATAARPPQARAGDRERACRRQGRATSTSPTSRSPEVRKVSPVGRSRRSPGRAQSGYSGDGGPATRAKSLGGHGEWRSTGAGNVPDHQHRPEWGWCVPNGMIKHTLRRLANATAPRRRRPQAAKAALSGPQRSGRRRTRQRLRHRVSAPNSGAQDHGRGAARNRKAGTGRGDAAAADGSPTGSGRSCNSRRQARRTLAGALTAGFNCSITPRAAGERVEPGRRQPAGPAQAARRPAGSPRRRRRTRCGCCARALQHSIEADIRYRAASTRSSTSGCPLPPNRSFTLARQSDTRASAAKRQFVAAYNPIAKRVGRRTWSANEI